MENIDLDQIAEQLSELSQPGQTPKLSPTPKAPTTFDADEVNFGSSEWLARVVEVSFWLNLDSTLDIANTPKAVAQTLFNELVPGSGTLCYSISESNVVLTETGADALTEKLSQAIGHRDSFWEALEEDQSITEATDAWVEAWNEFLITEPLSINASVSTRKIDDLEAYARRGRLNLNPTYQRDYVWPDSQSQMLIESVLRGIPLPSIILAEDSESNQIQVVDGKQRLTAILRFMGAHPEGRKNAENLKDFELFDSDFRKFARRNQLGSTDLRRLHLPFKTKKFTRENDPLKRLSGKFYCEIKDEIIRIAGEDVPVSDVFEKTTGYQLPVLIYRDASVSDIHNVFQLYNKQGMKLNAEEIRNAAFNNLIITRLILLLSGDRQERSIVSEVDTSDLNVASIHENINALNFSISRFRRTKVLFWAIATLFLEPKKKPGETQSYATPSTAGHIDRFLSEINSKELAQFQSASTLQALAKDLIDALELLQLCEAAWHVKFRSKKAHASKWEELPIIATMIACLVLVITKNEAKLYDGIELVRDKTQHLEGPESTQNKTQWEHIAKSSITILEALSIDLSDANTAIENRYGSCALGALIEIRNASLA